MKIGPQYKIARRLGARIFPKTQSAKFTLAGPEKKRGRGRATSTEYSSQLIEKQKAKYTYGISEKQFANYIKKVRDMKGAPAANLFKQLENRLDNVVFRLGLVGSRRFARQAVSHGHIRVNGRRLDIPSYQVRVNDVISIRPSSANNGIFKDIAERQKEYQIPAWLAFDYGKLEGSVQAEPQTGDAEANLNFTSILEFYSRV